MDKMNNSFSNDNSKWQIENSLTQMKIRSHNHRKTTQNGKLKLYSPQWNFSHQIPHNLKNQVKNTFTQFSFLYTPEKIPRDNTARPNSTKKILFSTSWKFDQANTHLFPFKGTNLSLQSRQFEFLVFFAILWCFFIIRGACYLVSVSIWTCQKLVCWVCWNCSYNFSIF